MCPWTGPGCIRRISYQALSAGVKNYFRLPFGAGGKAECVNRRSRHLTHQRTTLAVSAGPHLDRLTRAGARDSAGASPGGRTVKSPGIIRSTSARSAPALVAPDLVVGATARGERPGRLFVPALDLLPLLAPSLITDLHTRLLVFLVGVVFVVFVLILELVFVLV